MEILIKRYPMKVYHAVALALVGWYLIVPPVIGHQHTVDTEAPSQRWRIVRRFDTVDQCKASKEEGIRKAEAAKLNLSSKILDPCVATARIEAAMCVSTDDPRFREK